MYRAVPPTPARAEPSRVERLPGYAGIFTGLWPLDDGVLAAGDEGVSFIDGEGRATPVFKEAEVGSICGSGQHPERVFLGGTGAVRALRLDRATHQWVSEGIVARTTGSWIPDRLPPGAQAMASVRFLLQTVSGARTASS